MAQTAIVATNGAAENHAVAHVAQSSAAMTPMQMLSAAIERGANMDVLEKLMSLQERWEANQARKAFNQAFADAEAEMEPIAKDARNPDTKSKYATYAALDAAMRPIYTKHGFGFTWNTGLGDGSPIPPDCVRVLGKLSHKAGHVENYQIDMPCDGRGPKGGAVMSRTHATGSAFSYGRRYLQGGSFNIVFCDDDDGNAACRSASVVSDEQAEILRALITETRTNLEQFLTYAKAPSVSDVLAKDFTRLKAMLETKKAQQAKKESGQ